MKNWTTLLLKLEIHMKTQKHGNWQMNLIRNQSKLFLQVQHDSRINAQFL